MLEPSASRFWLAAIQSGLTDASTLRPCWDAIPPDKRVPEHIDRRLARQAVQSGVLTLWQAQQLIAGKSKGFKIDRYVMLDLIGQGGMGRVYLARDSRLNRQVAVKILSTERVDNPRAIVRFQREAEVGAQLQHENLVRIYDGGEAKDAQGKPVGPRFLVMEYIAGKNIGQMIAEQGSLPFPVAARLTRHVALGLEHARLKGLIHRDVNPYNILVTRDGVAKLTDLGLAIDLADSERVTRDGATVGTFDYVSPEQARHSHSVDARSDIYSLGCTLYHMLSGHVPYPTGSLPEKLYGHQLLDPEPLPDNCPAVPTGLADIVSKMMKKSPDERFQTPLELALALEPFCDDSAGFNQGLAPPPRTSASTVATNPDVTRTRLPGSNRAGSGTVTPATPEADGHAPELVAPPALALTPPPAPSPVPLPAAEITPLATKPVPRPKPAAVDVESLGLNLAVDFGPEPSLTEKIGSSRSRVKPKAKDKPSAGLSSSGSSPNPFASATSPEVTPGSVIATGSPVQRLAIDLRSSRWFKPVAAAAIFLGVFGLTALAYKWVADGKKEPGQNKQAAKQALPKTGLVTEKSKTEPRLPRELQGDEVEVVSADGKRSIELTLSAAMRAAMGARGHVVLGNAKPLKLSSADSTPISGGRLVIRAAEGTRPRLQIELKGNSPFLFTKSRAALVLEGLTFEVIYKDPGDHPAPLISAGSNLTLDRCAFKLDKDVRGARAVVAEGGELMVNGCWFENFERAIEVASFNGSTATVRQSMFVNKIPETKPDTPTSTSRWALTFRSMPGGAGVTGRRLKLQHCTFMGPGVLELAGFSSKSPAKVDLTACTVLTDALLRWDADGTPAPAPPDRNALSWAGLSNQYEVRGKSWVVMATDRNAPGTPLVEGPTDFDSWKTLLGNETTPVAPPVRFATDFSSIPEHPEPRDFAVPDQKADSPGAAPTFVGPGASALTARSMKSP